MSDFSDPVAVRRPSETPRGRLGPQTLRFGPQTRHQVLQQRNPQVRSNGPSEFVGASRRENICEAFDDPRLVAERTRIEGLSAADALNEIDGGSREYRRVCR